jgi:hypothetical protein
MLEIKIKTKWPKEDNLLTVWLLWKILSRRMGRPVEQVYYNPITKQSNFDVVKIQNGFRLV